MKALLTLAAVLSAVCVTASTALADPFITDTLGGTGRAATPVQGYRFSTDTLGGNGHAASAVRGYRFVTDTLAPGGVASFTAVQSAPAFSWVDAGIGAASAAGAVVILLGGALRVTRRRRTLAI